MTASVPRRVAALDLLRGATVAAMIVVNNPGNWNSVYTPLSHSNWNGVTFADLIFPAFIFIMGVSLSLARTPAPAGGGWSRVRRIATRALTLVAIGLTLNAAAAWPQLADMRVPGVLQRIGITYAATALIASSTSRRQQWVIAVALLLSHWALLAWPAAGSGVGALEPGANTAVWLDRWMFGTHILTSAGDPEGLLGVLTSVATALFGAIAGRQVADASARLHEAGVRTHLLGTLTAAGLAGIAVGYAWSFALPLNKPLWTASFAVFTAGAATLALVAFVAVESSVIASMLAPFEWLGTNPLAIYALSEFTTNLMQRAWLVQSGHVVALKDLIYWNWLVPLLGDLGGPRSSLAYAAGYTVVWIAVAGVLRRRGIRIRA